MFFLLRNSSPLFSITRNSSFPVIHVGVNIKNNAEKDTTLSLFFLSKSPGGHVISFQIKPWVAFGLPYLLIELFYNGRPVVPTIARSLAQCTVTWLPNFLGWVDYQISLAMGLRPRAALRAERGAPLWVWGSVLRPVRARGSPAINLNKNRRADLSVTLFKLYSFIFNPVL